MLRHNGWRNGSVACGRYAVHDSKAEAAGIGSATCCSAQRAMVGVQNLDDSLKVDLEKNREACSSVCETWDLWEMGETCEFHRAACRSPCLRLYGIFFFQLATQDTTHNKPHVHIHGIHMCVR